MNLRIQGLAWYRGRFGEIPKFVHVSRFYPPALSFTTQAAWAFQIPPHEVGGWGFSDVFLLHQIANESDDFGCLRIPTGSLLACLHHLYVRSDNGHISLFLSAEKRDYLRGSRGTGAIEFRHFAWNVHDLVN